MDLPLNFAGITEYINTTVVYKIKNMLRNKDSKNNVYCSRFLRKRDELLKKPKTLCYIVVKCLHKE